MLIWMEKKNRNILKNTVVPTCKIHCNTHPDYSGEKEQCALLFAILTVGVLFNTQFLLILRSPSLLITTKTSKLAIRLAN